MRFAHVTLISPRRRRGHRALCLERLEDRTMLSVELTATQGPPGTIGLSWTPARNVAWYQVESSYNLGNDYFTIGRASPSTTAYQDTGLYYDTLYTYRLLVHHTNGVNEYSNAASVYTAAALPNPYPISADSFNSGAINSAWSFVGGRWVQANGMLQQRDHETTGDIKKAILTDQSYPADQEITAKVLVESWSAGDMALRRRWRLHES